ILPLALHRLIVPAMLDGRARLTRSSSGCPPLRFAGQPADGGVEGGGELRAVFRRERLRAAGGLADRAQVGVEIASGEGIDDPPGGELATPEIEAADASINHLRGERDVGGED